MKTTLGTIKSGRIPQAVGMAACDPRFLHLLNDALLRLSEAGRWWGTVKRLRICVEDGCITWPSQVKNIEAVLSCGTELRMVSPWFEFRDNVIAPSDSCGPELLLDRGTVVQFRDLQAPSKIRLYVTETSDIGKRVLLQGYDENGMPIRTPLTGGAYVDGEYVTLASPYAESQKTFGLPGVVKVQKPVTNGSITVTVADENALAIWQHFETMPDYRRQYYNAAPFGCENCEDDEGDGCSPAKECDGLVLDAVVRVEWHPVRQDEDWLIISNQNAILEAMRSLQHEERNNYRLAEESWQRALRILRNEQAAYSPPEHVTVNALPRGTAKPSRVFGSFI